MKSLVSIIIPAFNAEHYVAETIQSAIDQTWPYKEIIIVDDGSTDNTLAIAKSFESDWIKVFSQTNNGASSARNRGLKEAQGKYIQFLDADDLLSADKISEQITLLEQNPDKLAMCSTVHFFDNNPYQDLSPSAYEEAFLFNDHDPVHFLINLYGGYTTQGSMITIHSWLTPKQVVDKAGPWNEELGLDDDGEFFCRMMLASAGIIKSNGICYYRKHTNQQSLSARKTLTDLKSRLKATVLKKQHLFTVNNSFEAQAVIYKALINIAAESYLTYPSVYSQAMRELPPIKLSYKPALGGRITTLLASVLGWRAVKFLKFNT